MTGRTKKLNLLLIMLFIVAITSCNSTDTPTQVAEPQLVEEGLVLKLNKGAYIFNNNAYFEWEVYLMYNMNGDVVLLDPQNVKRTMTLEEWFTHYPQHMVNEFKYAIDWFEAHGKFDIGGKPMNVVTIGVEEEQLDIKLEPTMNVWYHKLYRNVYVVEAPPGAPKKKVSTEEMPQLIKLGVIYDTTN